MLLLTKFRSFLTAATLTYAALASAQLPGVQMWSTNEFGVDLASNNIMLEIPLRTNSAGPNPISTSLIANFGVAIHGNKSGVYLYVPFQLTAGAVASGLLGVTPSTEVLVQACGSPGVNGTEVMGVIDSSGTLHSLSGYVNGIWTDHTFILGPTGGETDCVLSGQGTVVDGSGYTILGTSGSTNTYTVYDRSGSYSTLEDCTTACLGPFLATTPDGVSNQVSASGVFTDALSSTPVLTASVTHNMPNAAGSNYFSYTDASGNTQQYTVTGTTLMTVYNNNFGCEFSQMLPPTTYYLPTTITLPGTNGQYSIKYETTPGYSPDVTGRIASITYPSGGSISYSYSGGPNNDGYSCTISPTDGPVPGVVPILKITTNDNNGNVGQWTYTNSYTGPGSTFTVTKTGPSTALSPNGDQTVYTFGGEFLLEKQQYQGLATGTPLLTKVYCYNGQTTSCTSPPNGVVTLPITEIDVYTTPNGYSQSTRSQVMYDAVYGNETYSASYDFGANSPTTQKYIYYGQSWNGTSCSAYPSGSHIHSTPCYVKTTDGSGNILAQSKYVYSNTGHPTTSSIWTSGSNWLTTTRVYTAQGVIQSVTDPNNAVTTYSNYGCNGLIPEAVAFPLTSVGSASTVVDCNGGVTAQATDVNGNLYNYEYADPLYRYTGITKPDGGTESVSYGTSSYPWTVTTSATINSSETASTKATYDGFGQVVETATVDPSSSTGFNYTNIAYNNLGQKVSVSNPFFTTSDQTYGISTFAYDALGRVIRVTYPDSTSSTLTYLDRAIKTVDPSGVTIITQATGLSSHSDCLVTSAMQANGSSPAACGLDIAGTGFLGITSFDALGRMAASSLGSETRSYAYDGLSRLTSEITPEAGSTSFAYDTSSAGDLYQRIAPKANQTGSATTTTTYTWDLMHRATGVSYSDGTPSVTLSYDQTSALGQSLANYKGQMTYAATSGAPTTNQVAFSYDNVERTAHAWSCTPLTCGTSTQEIGATHNQDNSPATFTDYSTFPNRSSGVTFTYSYNTAQQMTGMSSNYTPNGNFPGTLFTASSMNAFGELTKYTYGSGASANTTTLAYDTHGRNSSRTNGTLYSFSLGFYPNGTIQSSIDSTDGSWQYTYDGFGRLSTAVETSPAQSFAYEYDQYGNRWGANSSCSSSNQTPCQYEFNTKNEITNDGVTYDAAGNMTYDGTFTYSYDAEGRITAVTQGTNHIASYVYDAFGHRTQEAIGSTTYAFIFDFAGRPYEKLEYSTTAGEYFQQTQLYAGVMPIGFYDSSCATCTGGTLFVINDWKGTLSFLTSPGGASEGSCGGYLPFGDGGTCNGNWATWNKPGYAGTWSDIETGLDKTDTRFLSPVQGRFLTPDPARSGWNLYVYGENDPVSNTDPSGLGDGTGCMDFDGTNACDFQDTQQQQGQTIDDPGLPINLVSTDPSSVITMSLVFNGGGADFGVNDGQLYTICNECNGFYDKAPEFIKEEILNSFAKPIGAPGFWGGLIPIYGSARTAINDFQTGHWGWGLVNTGLAISDVFLVKSLATAGGKLAIAGIAALTERSAIGATGKVGADALKALVGGETNRYFATSLGKRFVDQFAEGIAHEAKTGYTSLTAFTQSQISKDAWLVANNPRVESAVWHFYESPVTGLVGPSGPLRQALQNAGIKIVCPACP
jgi:RHS repeat-associated protein